MSPVAATRLNRPRISTLQRLFCKGGPEFRHSLKDGAPFQALVEASLTTLSLVLSADSRIPPLWGM